MTPTNKNILKRLSQAWNMITQSQNLAPDFYANRTQFRALERPKRVGCCDLYSAAPR